MEQRIWCGDSRKDFGSGIFFPVEASEWLRRIRAWKCPGCGQTGGKGHTVLQIGEEERAISALQGHATPSEARK